METQIKHLVTEIIGRLTPRLGADGQRGKVLIAITAATVGFSTAMDQLRQMVLKGYRLELAFSDHARALHRDGIMDQMAGFPFVAEINPNRWLPALSEARAVVVPLLSLNTASKAALLIADTLPTNLVLHGLALGKPVIMAANSADFKGPHWSGMRNDALPPSGLVKAAGHRLATLQELGCRLTDVSRLSRMLDALFDVRDRSSAPNPTPRQYLTPRKIWQVQERTVTAAHVRHAQVLGVDIQLLSQAVVTPLAREAAQKYRINLIPVLGTQNDLMFNPGEGPCS